MTTQPLYEIGALSVRPVVRVMPMTGTQRPMGFAVYFAHGIELDRRVMSVPPRTPNAQHPAHAGQEHPRHPQHFRNKSAARRYMEALHRAQILPEDRPATSEEVKAVKAFIESESETSK